MWTGLRYWIVSSAVTDGNRYQVASSPAASSSAAATSPPWTRPGRGLVRAPPKRNRAS